MQVRRYELPEFTSSSIVDDGARQVYKKSKAQKAAPPPMLDPVPPPPPPPPTYSEDDLKAAEQKGYQRGFAEGMEDGKRQLDQQQAELQAQLQEHMEHFTKAVKPLFADYRKMVTGTRRQVPEIALAAARKVAGQALEDNAAAVIEEMALAAYQKLLHEPRITITLHESMADMLQGKLEALTAKLQTHNDIVILRDPDMPTSDCRIEWAKGEMERNTDQIWGKLEQAITNLSLSAEREANEELDELEATLPTEEKKKETRDQSPVGQAATQPKTTPAPQPVMTPAPVKQTAPDVPPVRQTAPGVPPVKQTAPQAAPDVSRAAQPRATARPVNIVPPTQPSTQPPPQAPTENKE